MKTFDLDQYYKQIREAITPEQVALLRKGFNDYSESLTKEERDVFRQQLEESAREEIIRSRAIIDLVNEIRSAKPETA